MTFEFWFFFLKIVYFNRSIIWKVADFKKSFTLLWSYYNQFKGIFTQSFIIISPHLSSAEHRPPLEHTTLLGPPLYSSSAHPAILRLSSDHRVGGRLTLRLPRRGLRSKTRLLQQPSVLRQIWPAHCHFSLLILRAMSITLVLSQIISFLILFARVTPSIARPITRCAT